MPANRPPALRPSAHTARARAPGVALLACAALSGLAGATLPAHAQELSWSGFGTVGFSQSNRPYTYERFVDDSGTFKRDTLFGLQVDARLDAQWSATLQLKASPALDSDSRWAVTPSWAFVAWRPSDDWLVRGGRLRLPLYLHSESLDVDVSRDMARLPIEMYSIAPSTDVDGLFVTKTWPRDTGELSLDGYVGQIKTTTRQWTRDGMPGAVPPGAFFLDIKAKLSGVVLTWRRPQGTWRAGLHRGSTRPADGRVLPVSYGYQPLGPGLGYYQVDDDLPGPGLQTTSRVRNHIITLGVDESLGDGWRLTAEFARMMQHDTELGSDSRGGYVALSRQIGRVTPYVSVGALRSSQEQFDWHDRLTSNPLPAMIPGAAQINAAQRLAAESIYATDQRALALGGSWAVKPQQKIKAEWKRTYFGRVSRLVDTPPGGDVRDSRVDVLSVVYSFAF